MNKRSLVRLALVSCLVLAGLVLFLRWTSPNARINRESFEQIRTGMTEEEVIDILGVAPNKYDLDYVSRRVNKMLDVVAVNDSGLDNSILSVKAWVADGLAIRIGFDHTGTARSIFYIAFDETALNRFRRRLRLP